MRSETGSEGGGYEMVERVGDLGRMREQRSRRDREGSGSVAMRVVEHAGMGRLKRPPAMSGERRR